MSPSLQDDLLTLKVVSESRVTWATSVPILVFLGLCYRLKPDVRDRQTSDAHHRLMPLPYGGGGIIMIIFIWTMVLLNHSQYSLFTSVWFLPRDAMRKRGLCCRPVSDVRLSVCPSEHPSVCHVDALYPDS